MNNNWHNVDIDEIYNILKTSNDGLSISEVKNRQEQYGKNILPKKKKDSIIKLFLKQMEDPILILLIIASIFSYLAGEYTDAITIIFIIFIDLIIGTIEELRAIKSASKLESLIAVTATVIRDKKVIDIESSELVPGDIVVLRSGDKVVADMRLINSKNLTIDESILTGESINVPKNVGIIDSSTPLAQRKNMVFAGTLVTTGTSTCVVVETGINTQIGIIAKNVNQAKKVKTPLNIRTEKFSKQISSIFFLVSLFVAGILYFKGYELREIFLSVIALLISAMPEGLPLAFTMALTIASNRMMKENVIVKDLSAVEGLGSCTVIATDKTGTLTINKQTAKKIVLPDSSTFDIAGDGHEVKNIIKIVDRKHESSYKKIALSGVINNEAYMEFNNNEWVYSGDSIDIALLVLGNKLNVSKHDIDILKLFPYESENKYSAVIYEFNNKYYCTVKGSVETVLSFCSKMDMVDNVISVDNDLILNQNEKLAKSGYRVMAFATSEIRYKAEYSTDDINDLVFTGLIGFIDPLRVDAKEAVETAKKAGVKVIMITGDHPLTAYSIANRLGIETDIQNVITSRELETKYNQGEKIFDDFISDKCVFSRVTPIEKLQIVESLKRSGEYVAVTGDGVNDAPALKSANIGVAMGSGTDVARDSASLIVTDDSFKSIVTGIKEGRLAYNNIRRVIYMLLSCGFAEVLFFLLSLITGFESPLTAIQLLWLNIVTDGLQDLALSFERETTGIMDEKPRNPKESILDKKLFSEIMISGITMSIIVFAVWFYINKHTNLDLVQARGYVMLLMIFMQNLHVLNCRSEKLSIFKIPFFSNPFVLFSILSSLVLQIFIFNIDILARYIGVKAIPINDILILFIYALPVVVVMEIYKILQKKEM